MVLSSGLSGGGRTLIRGVRVLCGGEGRGEGEDLREFSGVPF